MEAPASFRNPRRETGSSHSPAPRGNSRCKSSPNAGWSASSCSVLQYLGPLEPASFLRTVSSSRLAGLISPGEIRSGCESVLFDIRFQFFSFHLAMASGATGYILHRAQVVLLFQIIPQRHLAEVILAVPLHRVVFCRLLVGHIENFFFGPQELLRLAMAIQAPFHLQRVLFVHERHLVHRAMTTETADSLGDMNAVIEIDIVRQIMHAVPLDRFTGAEAG